MAKNAWSEAVSKIRNVRRAMVSDTSTPQSIGMTDDAIMLHLGDNDPFPRTVLVCWGCWGKVRPETVERLTRVSSFKAKLLSTERCEICSSPIG